MVEHLYGPDVDFVDWRRFLLCVALPWPLPSAQDLLEAWAALVPEQEEGAVDRKMVDKEQFMSTEIWLDKPAESRDEAEPVFDKNHALKDVCVFG